MSPLKPVGKNKTGFLLFLTFLFSLFAISQPFIVQSAIIKPKAKEKESTKKLKRDYVPGEVLVKLKQIPFQERRNFHSQVMNTEVMRSLRQIGVDRIKGKGGETTEELIERYKNNPFVEYVEPNIIYEIQLTPNDPQFNQLYSLHNTGQSAGLADADIDAPEAWDLQTGSNSVVVASIDTGVDYTHADLAANMWINPGEIAGNGIDDDNNGFIDDVRGWDFLNNDNDPFDDHGHGSHTAGTMAAVGNNGVGIAGVSWRAKIMPLKFISPDGLGTTEDAVEAIIYAADMGAKISNNSYGCIGLDCFSQAEQDAIAYANTKGMLFVAAAGNNSSNNDTIPTYPCNFALPNVICVAATDHNDQRASFSNYGPTTVHLGAPGVDILSTVPTGPNCELCTPSGYIAIGGTSMASPHVAGAAALLRAQFPTATVAQIRLRILNNVDPIASMNGVTITGGRLNVDKALRAPNPVIAPTNLTAVDRPADTGGAINLSWTPSTDTGITQQRIYRSTVSTGPFSLLITFSNNTTASHTDTATLTNGTRYYYVVRAFNGTVESANSNKASAYPINNSDVTAPTLSGISTADVASSLARVLWTTNEISDTQVEYGTTTAYGSSTPIRADFITGHSTTIPNLTPSTLYHYRVKSRDVAGNLAVSSDFTFTTLPPGADGTWEAKASTPGFRSVAGVGVIGNTLYIAGGTGVPSVWFQAYDPGSNSWNNRQNMPTGRWSLGVGVVNNILYAVGGYETFAGSRATVEAYNPSTNSWSAKAPMQVARSGHAVGVINGKLYAAGGFDSNGGALNVVEEYNPATNSWTYKTQMSAPRGNMGYGVINGIFYVAGGWNGGGYVATVEAYDPATDSWTTKASLPTARGGVASGVINNLLYVVGGQTNVTTPLQLLTETLSYNPIDDAWAARTPMPTPRAGLGGGVLNGLLYAIAGHDNQGSPISTVEAFTPFTQPTLVVTKAGTGSGTVTSSPAGINCGTTCSAAYALNTSVTLTASPAAGSTFAGWSGDCTGTGSCIVTINTSKSVTATFSASIAAGGRHTCALASGGTVKCWGYNYNGQLGNNSTTNSPSPVTVVGIANARAVVAGDAHSCALLSDQSVRCWGANYYGQLGNGDITTLPVTTPVTVSGVSASAISAGGYHTCAVLLDSKVKCWGYNSYGQLGNGNQNNSSTPVLVGAGGGITATAVSAGMNHSCAVLTNQSVNCWGYNYWGFLGDGTNTNSSLPVLVSGGIQATAISAGSHNSCAILLDRSVQCWGWYLGNGTTNNSLVPVPVSGISNAIAITAGRQLSQTCVLLSTGSVSCWGDNQWGQLGNGTMNNAISPVPVSGLTTTIGVSAGGFHTCAVTNQTVWCWGNGASGQLGNGMNSSTIPVAVNW